MFKFPKKYREFDLNTYCCDIKHRVTSRAIVMPNGCHEYRGGNLKHKYGLVSITLPGEKRKSIPAHRALYMAVNQCFDLERNIYICHKCDNPSCVNIDHLFPGTPKDNSQDCLNKGRGRKGCTYLPHTRMLKLTDQQVREIRASSDLQRITAEKYGITTGYVCKLRKGNAKPLVK